MVPSAAVACVLERGDTYLFFLVGVCASALRLNNALDKSNTPLDPLSPMLEPSHERGRMKPAQLLSCVKQLHEPAGIRFCLFELERNAALDFLKEWLSASQD